MRRLSAERAATLEAEEAEALARLEALYTRQALRSKAAPLHAVAWVLVLFWVAVGLLVALWARSASAQPPPELRVLFSWAPPTERTDGTLIAPAGVEAYGIDCGPAPGNHSALTFYPLVGTNYVATFAAAGTYYCIIGAKLEGEWSADSNEVAVTVPWVDVTPPPRGARARSPSGFRADRPPP